jgi:hypothetical protein
MNRKSDPPSTQNRLQRPKRATLDTQSKIIRRLIVECQDDANEARRSRSWQAVNTFSRLERQLWIDLAAATKREAEEAAAAEEAAMAARPDAELLGSIIAAVRAMPADQRDQLLEALSPPAPLRVVQAGG